MKKALFFLFFLPSIAFSATEFQPTQTFPITGGVNMGVIPQRIGDDESPDMSNFVCDDQSCYVRNGTRRFNTTAISTNPIQSLYKGYSSSGKSIFLCTTADKILVSTVTDLNNLNVFYTSGNHTAIWKSTATERIRPVNTRFSFATFNNDILMVNQTTYTLRYDIDAGSISLIGGDPPNAKFILVRGEYVLMANTTDQPNTIFYSDVSNVDSWPINNQITFQTSKGETITGMTNARDGVKIYFDNSIWKLNFTVLSSDIDGNQVPYPMFEGFGCIAPYSLTNFGDGDFFLARDGFRLLIGGNSFIVSDKVRPIVERIIESGTYDSVVSFFDKKNKWIWVAYEDDLRYPKGVNNRVLIYDLRLNQWYIIDGIYANAFGIWDGGRDKNELFYGESFDGYVYQMDVDGLLTDARLEMPLLQFEANQVGTQSSPPDGCETSGAQLIRHTTNYLESDSSLFRNNFNSNESSCLNVRRNTVEYPNKIPINDRDLIQFYLLCDDIVDANQLFRFSFDWYDQINDSNEVRYEISGVAITTAVWNKFTVPISNRESFLTGTIEPKIALKNQLRRIVMRVNNGGIDHRIDDFRIVQSTENPIIAYRYVKPFDMGRVESKTWGNAYINMETNPNTEFSIDVISDFKDSVIERKIQKEFNDKLYISSGGFIQQINKTDYKLVRSSDASDKNITALYATKDFLWGLSRQNRTIYKMDLTTNTLLAQTSSFGNLITMSSPTSITAIGKDIFVADHGNNRIIKCNFDLTFISSMPVSGVRDITSDNNYIYGLNATDREFVKYDSNFNFILRFADNIFSSSTLFVTSDYLITALIRNDDFAAASSSVPVIQLRDKETLQVLKEIRQLNPPANTLPIHIISDGNYIFYTTTGSYKLQKYTYKTLDLVDETQLTSSLDGLASNSYFVPNDIKKIPLGVIGRYLQLRYRINQPRNKLRLYDQTFTAVLQELR